MSNNIEVKFPNGIKVELQPYTAGKKKGHALLNPDTGTFNGFGVIYDAACKTLPEWVEVNGSRVDLTKSISKSGHPRVGQHGKVIPEGRTTIRLVDFQDGTWNYVMEVSPPSRRKATTTIFK